VPTALVFLALICTAEPTEWTKLPALPDAEGFAGSFAGVSHGSLVVAGGANFPDKKPWEGGKKVWTDTVFVLDRPDGEWKSAGKLPRPLGYGVSVTHRNGIVCVGGSDSERHHADAFRLEWKDGKLKTTELPPLPRSVANACGALLGDVLYVAGGQEKPDSATTLKAVYRLDLSAEKPKWEEVEPLPAGRMLSAAVACDGAFWVMGGVDLKRSSGQLTERVYAKDVYRYDPGRGWKSMPALPHPVAAAPSPAPADATGFLILGGDDGSQVGIAPGKHAGFQKTILRYDLAGKKWTDAGTIPAPRVTTACVRWADRWVVPSGETRPGVRSPEVWATK
jgi:N-acetylneuraminate epimerase